MSVRLFDLAKRTAAMLTVLPSGISARKLDSWARHTTTFTCDVNLCTVDIELSGIVVRARIDAFYTEDVVTGRGGLWNREVELRNLLV